jgi:glutamine synthetase
MEDQYFGRIPSRVLACMSEVESELYKVGVPVKTRHNEVAPSQYEIAPVFENANLAVDHQLMTMETLQRVAPKYGLACLLHEKPFAGVNGSGKHNNWSLSDEFGNNLLGPGDTPHDNMQFLVFCAAVLKAVDDWQGVLRASIASAGNDHRLGANEAPPAILSVFLGDQLTDIFEQLEKGAAKSTKQGGIQDLGVSVLPKLPRDAGDRNRTSPFAFTGNKFEFRAVRRGRTSHGRTRSSTRRWPIRWTRLPPSSRRHGQGRGSQGRRRQAAHEDHQEAQAHRLQRQQLLGRVDKEAGKRGLLNLKNTVDALPQLVTPQAIKLMDRFKILNDREMHARYEVFLENYNKTINIEGQLMVLMANRYILPAAFEYQKQIGQSVAGGKGWRRQERPGQEAARTLHEARRQAEDRTRCAGEAARPQHGSAGEAREVHARQGRAGDGQAARDRRQHRGADAARAVAAAHVPGDAVRQVRMAVTTARTGSASGPASVPARRVFTGLRNAVGAFGGRKTPLSRAAP